MAIGNGWSDPMNQFDYGDYLYQIGLIDTKGRDEFHVEEKRAKDAIANKDFETAFEIMDMLIDGDQYKYGSLFKNLSGYNFYFNYMQIEDDGSDASMFEFLKRTDVRKAIHVGNLPFNDGTKVEDKMKLDVMDSVAPLITELLSSYRILFYNGQLDIIVAYPLTINYLKILEFDNKEAYMEAPRYIWRIDDDIAGYVHETANIIDVLVRKAGHMVPKDQGKFALDLITRFTREKSFAN